MGDTTRLDATESATGSAPNWSDWGADGEFSVQIPPRPTDRCYVYIVWGASRKRPLYVGKARDVWSRFGSHMARKPWAGEVRRLEWHGFRTEKEALAAELEAILALDPIHNIQRNEPPSVIAERNAWWRQRQEQKRADLIARRAAEAERSRKWAEARAARPPRPKPIRRVVTPREPRPVVVSPHPRKRLRQVKWRDDVFTPDQLAIIAKVQNRGRSA